MGCGMAANLLNAGHRVTVWNRSRGPVEALTARGAIAAAAPDDAFKGDATVTMLADDQAVRDVVLGSGALDAAHAGLVHVVSATISVALAKELETRHADMGLGYVAAPVLGRPDVAQQGQLNVLAAGDDAAIAKVQPLLDVIGKRTWRVGEAPGCAARQVHQPKGVGAFVGGVVCCPQIVDHMTSVRRKTRVGKTRQGCKILRRKRPRLSRRPG